ELRGKVAVVTGGASGIGRAMAERFAAEGMRLVLADIDDAVLGGAVKELLDAGTDVIGVVTDVADAAAVEALAAATIEHHGAVHVVCNNAGVVSIGSAWETTSDVWSWVVGVNLMGVVNGVRAFVPRLLAQ